MIAAGMVILQGLACLGLGATLLHCLGLLSDLRPSERLSWCFALGFGVLGWVLFFVGVSGFFAGTIFLLLLAVSSCGVLLLHPLGLNVRPPQGRIEWLLCLLFLGVLFGDVLEGLSPPADADTLAYHFALPKDYLAAGRLTFVPRAGDGTQPMLAQLTYLPVLALGGERALTLWTMVSGLGVIALFYTTLRRFVAVHWAAAATLILLTTPAIIYGSGSGQIDVRAAMLAIPAALSIHQARTSGRLAPMLLAGLATGFLAGTKYQGLIFLAAASLVVLLAVIQLKERWFAKLVAFGGAAFVGGFQWYVWNWLNSGDPIYPMLLPYFNVVASYTWPADFYLWFKQGVIDVNVEAPISLFWWLFYPISATFSGLPVFESGRTGLGLFAALAFPFAVLGAWQARARLFQHPLMPALLIALLFYTLWFFSGSGQRVRFLVPVYPLLLAALTVAAVRYAVSARNITMLTIAMVLVIAIQLAGDALYTANYARHVFTGENRDDFLDRNVGKYEAVRWINRNLMSSDRVFTLERQTIYLYEIPVYYGHIYADPSIDFRPTTRPELTIRQLRDHGITHVLTGLGAMNIPFDRYEACFERIKTFSGMVLSSRTLNQSERGEDIFLFHLRPDCPVNAAAG